MPLFWGKKRGKMKKTRSNVDLEEELFRKEMKKRETLKIIARQRLELLRPEITSSPASFSSYFHVSSEDEIKDEEQTGIKEELREGSPKGSGRKKKGPDSPKSADRDLMNNSKKMHKRVTVVVDSLDDFPEDIKQSIKRTKLSEEEIKDNFEILLTALSLGDKRIPKRNFITSARKKLISSPSYSSRKEKNVHSPSFRKKEEDIFETLTLLQTKKDYKVEKHLGDGGYGDVMQFKVMNKSLSHSGHVAIKFQSATSASVVRDECSLLLSLEHKNICQVYRCMKVLDEFWIVMELMEGGNLREASTSGCEPYDESEIAYVAKEMLHGIQYLHSRKIVHRDLKNQNVMLTIEGGVKLIDFGASFETSRGPRKEIVGSPFWMAPEMLRLEPYEYSVDIWSFSICMFELANKRPPNSDNVKRAMFMVATKGIEVEQSLEQLKKWSSCFKDFLTQATQFSPSERATAKDLLAHPFLEKAASPSHMKKKLKTVFRCDIVNEGMSGVF